MIARARARGGTAIKDGYTIACFALTPGGRTHVREIRVAPSSFPRLTTIPRRTCWLEPFRGVSDAPTFLVSSPASRRGSTGYRLRRAKSLMTPLATPCVGRRSPRRCRRGGPRCDRRTSQRKFSRGIPPRCRLEIPRKCPRVFQREVRLTAPQLRRRPDLLQHLQRRRHQTLLRFRARRQGRPVTALPCP